MKDLRLAASEKQSVDVFLKFDKIHQNPHSVEEISLIIRMSCFKVLKEFSRMETGDFKIVQ